MGEVEVIFSGFQLATMLPPRTVLAANKNGEPLFQQPDAAYGAIEHGVIGVAEGKIRWILPLSMLPTLESDVEVIQGHGRWLTPGLIDCHTHLVYGGQRSHEWEARLLGKSYADIAREGGGILSSVRSTREASEDSLFTQASKRLARLMSEGVTTIEIKSGYGLDLESELKMLRVARRLGETHNISVQTTLLAAHSLPPEFVGRADAYVDFVCREVMVAAQEQGLCDAVDVFCERIAFDVPQSERVLKAGLDLGLKIKAHAEQLTHSGMAVIAAKMGAVSVDHLEYLTAEDCRELAQTRTVATLLPGAYYCLNEPVKPPVAALRQHGVPMAVATDANPGSSPVGSLLLMGNMACNLFGLTPEEALRGMTVHAATALGMSDDRGGLRPGSVADFAIWGVHSPAEIVFGIGHNPCVGTYRAGVLRS